MEKHKAELIHHKETGTYWSNRKDWKEIWAEEPIMFAESVLPETNIFKLKTEMHKRGYEIVKAQELEGTQFKMELKHNNEG